MYIDGFIAIVKLGHTFNIFNPFSVVSFVHLTASQLSPVYEDSISYAVLAPKDFMPQILCNIYHASPHNGSLCLLRCVVLYKYLGANNIIIC